MVAYNLRKVENRDRYPDPPQLFVLTASGPVFVVSCGSEAGYGQRIGAAEARWAHNPEVIRSKRIFATFLPFLAHHGRRIGQKYRTKAEGWSPGRQESDTVAPSELAQRKRAGLITQRSHDRNMHSLLCFSFFCDRAHGSGGGKKRRSCRESNPDLGIQSPQ